MTQPVELLRRFTRTQRWVHRSTAALMGLCIATAAMLYLGPLSVLVGRRHLVAAVHVYAGIALPVPMLAGVVSAAYRHDLGLLNRFTATDWAWLRSRERRAGRIPIGKFNPGQKLNAAFVAGSILVMLGTGLLMRYANAWPVRWRTGATFVHDWLAYAVVAVIAGHLWFASRDPVARLGMRTGLVPRYWARREHPAWEAASSSDH
ncbi:MULTISPECIES: cytochrome b/b6 domain-containing protein [unclassified Frankia]|uniref:cytochrome b/b6 domain-containing protein n=1 Tax=unclassified Frankia TaxID=2632575 RepID=UPI002AD2E364|nr:MULTISPECIES: cytochrome b/b6 domain-containing protein [unclassified Frankia]